MDITEVRINFVESRKGSLRASCSIVFDNALTVHGIKILEEPRGLIVVMPDKEITRHCVKCSEKNPIQATFCNKCGIRLTMRKADRDINNNLELYVDVAHPLNKEFDKLIQEKVIEAYKIALKNQPINPVSSVDSGENESMQRFIPKPLNASPLRDPVRDNGVKAERTVPTDINEAGFPKFS